MCAFLVKLLQLKVFWTHQTDQTEATDIQCVELLQ